MLEALRFAPVMWFSEVSRLKVDKEDGRQSAINETCSNFEKGFRRKIKKFRLKNLEEKLD